MTTHAHHLITALARLDRTVADRISAYRSRSLTDEQATWWLDDLRLLTALVPPTDVDDAIAMLGAGSRFLAESGADDAKPTFQWFTVTRIEAWLGQQVATGRTTETVRKIGFRLDHMRRASLGAPARTYVRDRRVGLSGLGAADLVDVERTLTGHRTELGAWVAIAGAGLHPNDLTGATYTATPAGVEVVGADGTRFPVLEEFTHLAAGLAGLVLPTGAWRDMRTLLRDDAIDAGVTDAVASFHARVFDGRDSVLEVVKARRIGLDRLHRAGRTVRALPAPEIGPEVLRGSGIVPADEVSTVGCNPSVSGGTGSPRMAQRVSRAAAQRRMAQAQQRAASVPPASPTLTGLLDGYVPAGMDDATWTAIAAVHREILVHSELKSPEALRKARSVLAQFLAFRHSEGESLTIAKSCTIAAVDAFFARGMSEFEARTRNDYRTRLDRLVRAVIPGVDAPPKLKAKYQTIRAGYTVVEEAKLRRIASRQPNARTQQQACAIVGLSCGAGLDATELRHLYVRQIVDHDTLGIEVVITGVNARHVWVRREYEDLVRAGIAGLAPDRTLLGRGTAGRNLVNGTLARLQYSEQGLVFDAARMRTTWLTWLVAQPLSLRSVLDVSGLQSARTLSEIIDLLPPTPTAALRPLLRGEA